MVYHAWYQTGPGLNLGYVKDACILLTCICQCWVFSTSRFTLQTQFYCAVLLSNYCGVCSGLLLQKGVAISKLPTRLICFNKRNLQLFLLLVFLQSLYAVPFIFLQNMLCTVFQFIEKCERHWDP